MDRKAKTASSTTAGLRGSSGTGVRARQSTLSIAERTALLLPLVAACADQAEQAGELQPKLLEALFEHNLFRLLLPEHCGGEAVSFLEFMTLVQHLAEVDGSTAWCVNQGAIFATNSSRLPVLGAETLWQDADVVIAHGPPTEAVAQPVDGGHRLTGHWSFGSGSHHSRWLAGVAFEAGAPKGQLPRTYFFPTSAAVLHGTWDTAGLRATGSDDFSVQNLFVPEHMSYSPTNSQNNFSSTFYELPSVLLFACGFASVMLGVARGMLDEMLALAIDKRRKTTFTKLANDPHVHQQIGEAEALWRSAYHYVRGEVADVLAAIQADIAPDYEQRVRLRLAGTHGLRQARAVADIAWNICGTSGIYTGHSLQRRYQDILVGCQHMQARTAMYPMVGRYFLGVDDNLGPLV